MVGEVEVKQAKKQVMIKLNLIRFYAVNFFHANLFIKACNALFCCVIF